MSSRGVKEVYASKIAAALLSGKPIRHNRLVGMQTRSGSDTQLYILAHKSQASVYTPVILREEDSQWCINVQAISKGTYDRGLIRRVARSLRPYSAITMRQMEVVAQWGAAGIVLGKSPSRTPQKSLRGVYYSSTPSLWEVHEDHPAYNLIWLDDIEQWHSEEG